MGSFIVLMGFLVMLDGIGLFYSCLQYAKNKKNLKFIGRCMLGLVVYGITSLFFPTNDIMTLMDHPMHFLTTIGL